MTMPEIYSRLATDISTRSKCLRASVGAVITSEDFTQVYSVGYNGGARKQENSCTGEAGNCGCIHAEINALIKVKVNDPRKVLFVTTFPCKVCAAAIVNSGFIKVYYHEDYRDMTATKILTEAGIEYEKI